MRVINKNNEEKIHKCEYCGSKIAYTWEDVIVDWNDYVICPICKHGTEISIFDRKVRK